RTRSPAALADRFHLLPGAPRGALPRQQTLRASVDWSHDLLSDQERVLFRRLGAFAGGFTLDAAEQVCSDDQLDRYTILDLLTALVAKSLVLASERGPAVRYGRLETVGRPRARRGGTGDGHREPRARDLTLRAEVGGEAEPALGAAGSDGW